MILKFKIPGAPQGKARARTVMNPRTGRVNSFTPENTVLYENLIKASYLEQCGSRIRFEKDEPIYIKILAGFPIPKSTSKKKQTRCFPGPSCQPRNRMQITYQNASLMH